MVGIGGAIGSCLRYGITLATLRLGWVFPLGTLLSNVIAGFAIGLIVGLEAQSLCIPPRTKLFLNTGLLGGLSTFSTFSLETVRLYSAGNYLHAAGNVILNLGLSLLGVVLGMVLARIIKKV
ncbi:MAG: camphor resistance protein CrcB [Firmicutes bacterium]|nr:camphor resistance protein CrcB [Bacillota bacterium]